MENEENKVEEVEVTDLDLEKEEGQAEGPSELELAEARIAELEAKNTELFARAKKAEGTKKAPIHKPTQGENSDWQKRIDFITMEGRELDKDEVSEVIAYAEGKGLSYAEAMKSKVMQAYLQERKTEKRVESAIPSSSSSSFRSNNKSWGEMNDEERAQNFHAYIASKRRA